MQHIGAEYAKGWFFMVFKWFYVALHLLLHLLLRELLFFVVREEQARQVNIANRQFTSCLIRLAAQRIFFCRLTLDFYL